MYTGSEVQLHERKARLSRNLGFVLGIRGATVCLKTHTHKQTRSHTHTLTDTFSRRHPHTRTCTHTHVHTRSQTNTHASTYIHTSTHTRKHTHTRTNTYTHAYTHGRTNTHARTMRCILLVKLHNYSERVCASVSVCVFACVRT